MTHGHSHTWSHIANKDVSKPNAARLSQQTCVKLRNSGFRPPHVRNSCCDQARSYRESLDDELMYRYMIHFSPSKLQAFTPYNVLSLSDSQTAPARWLGLLKVGLSDGRDSILPSNILGGPILQAN